MRHEPPVLTEPAPGAAPLGAAGPVLLPESTSARLSQDHAPRRGMSMILTKAFYRVFAVIAFGVGALGVVITVNDLSMVLLGAPLMLIGFICAVKMLASDPRGSDFISGGEYISEKFASDDLWDTDYIATGEMRVIDQITRGEGRFADPT